MKDSEDGYLCRGDGLSRVGAPSGGDFLLSFGPALWYSTHCICSCFFQDGYLEVHLMKTVKQILAAMLFLMARVMLHVLS